jgi:1,4-alpha-glucan branching enzyme
MWLFGKEIYENMGKNCKETLTINRGIALHKMIRLITFVLGGEVKFVLKINNLYFQF